MLQNCFRISVGTPEENDALLEALGRIFKISD
jgi:histidinol-phosphate/aromatic aminotransferase/cobyric acid decarboxylase-like protein